MITAKQSHKKHLHTYTDKLRAEVLFSQVAQRPICANSKIYRDPDVEESSIARPLSRL